MKPNIEALNALLRTVFGNNISKMAREMKITRNQLDIVLKENGKGAGALFCGAIITYCEDNNMNFRDYIFLP